MTSVESKCHITWGAQNSEAEAKQEEKIQRKPQKNSKINEINAEAAFR